MAAVVLGHLAIIACAVVPVMRNPHHRNAGSDFRAPAPRSTIAHMRELKAWLYMTIDGVVEAPEKWVMPDARMFEEQTAEYAASDALLLGRRTYEVFAAAWPQRGSDVPNADWMNNTRKYVASTTLESPDWQNTTVLRGDVRDSVSQLKQEDGRAITVNGSAGLVRSLLGAGLIDELRLFLHPVVVGSGERLFEEMPGRLELRLADCHSYDNGVLSLAYRPTAERRSG
jgi:dihydrofolate reductase